MTNSQNHQKELAADRFSLKVTARLSEGANALPRDTTERLRAARVRAIASRKPMQVNNPTFVAGSGVAGAVLSGGRRSAWWGTPCGHPAFAGLADGSDHDRCSTGR